LGFSSRFAPGFQIGKKDANKNDTEDLIGSLSLSLSSALIPCIRYLYLYLYTWQFFVTFLGWLSDLFKGLSDLQLGDEKVTLNHLVP